jgi:predicted nucleic acid-binding protein
LAEVTDFQKHFPLLTDTSDVLVHWLQLVQTNAVSGKRVHDARLVAVMKAHGVTHLMTFNQEHFRCFSEIVLIRPDSMVEKIEAE